MDEVTGVDNYPGYDGYWERAGRSPGTAALMGLLLTGALYFIGQIVLQLFGMAVWELFTPHAKPSGDLLTRLFKQFEIYALPTQIAVVLSQYFFMLLPVWLLVKKWHTPDVRKYIRLKKSPVAEIVLAVIATVMIIPTGEFIAGLIVKYLGVPDEFSKIGQQLLTAHSGVEFIWLIFVAALTPAICEEIFFRGYVQRTLERVIGKKSIWVVGIIFGLFHLQPLGLVTLAIIGMMLGYLYHRSRSLLPSMAAHFTNNLIALYLLYRPPVLFGVDLAKTGQLPVLWIAVTLPMAAIALLCFGRITRHKRTESPAHQ